MLYDLLRVALFCLLAWCIAAAIGWVLFQARYVFMIRVEDGKARVTKGTVGPIFMQQLAEELNEAKVTRGWIGGVRKGGRVTLVFSGSIPPTRQQRLRNLWLERIADWCSGIRQNSGNFDTGTLASSATPT